MISLRVLVIQCSSPSPTPVMMELIQESRDAGSASVAGRCDPRTPGHGPPFKMTIEVLDVSSPLTHSIGKSWENHRKQIRYFFTFVRQFVHVRWFYRNSKLKSSVILFPFDMNLKLFDLLMESPKTFTSMILRLLGRVSSPKTNYFCLCRPQDT